VIGYSPDPAEARAAEQAGAVHATAPSPGAAAEAADLVVLAAPPGATLDLLSGIAPVLRAGTVCSDVASVKGCIVERACTAGLERRFAGAHPLAGTHGSGFGHASPDLLRGCVVYVCPTGPHGAEPARVVAAFWAEVFQARPVEIDALEHDRQLAWTSHLPQAVAYALARSLASRELPPAAFGAGARDTTRLAASSPELWIDIFLRNRDAVLAGLDDADGQLRRLRHLIAERDEAGLRRFLEPAASLRRSLEP
jgi:prephenate dehydrogenase